MDAPQDQDKEDLVTLPSSNPSSTESEYEFLPAVLESGESNESLLEHHIKNFDIQKSKERAGATIDTILDKVEMVFSCGQFCTKSQILQTEARDPQQKHEKPFPSLKGTGNENIEQRLTNFLESDYPLARN